MLLEDLFKKKNEEGKSLGNHLKIFYKNLISNKENQILEKDFCKISKKLKTESFNIEKKTKKEIFEKTEQKLFFEDLLKSKKENLEKNSEIEDINKKFNLLKEAGINLSKTEKFILQAQIKKISKKKKNQKIFFFGKIFTLTKDYYILVSYKKDLKIFDINSPIFFCSQNLKNWEELPKILPKDIRLSRKTKKIFSGNLKKKIKKNFLEKKYLKCQLIRILFSNVIIPENYFLIDEENEKIIKKNLEFIFEKEKFLNKENWVYKFPKILINGSINYSSIKNEEDLLTIEEKFPKPELLKNIINENSNTNWKNKKFGKKNFICIEEENISLSIFLLQNENWKGATNYFSENEKNFGFIYFGFGLKKNQNVVSKKIEGILCEPKFRDNREMKEPNPPEDNSDILETDSDPEEDDE